MLIASEKTCILLNAIMLRIKLIWKIREGYFEQVKIELRSKGIDRVN